MSRTLAVILTSVVSVCITDFGSPDDLGGLSERLEYTCLVDLGGLE